MELLGAVYQPQPLDHRIAVHTHTHTHTHVHAQKRVSK